MFEQSDAKVEVAVGASDAPVHDGSCGGFTIDCDGHRFTAVRATIPLRSVHSNDVVAVHIVSAAGAQTGSKPGEFSGLPLR